jgi:hypothetical protein
MKRLLATTALAFVAAAGSAMAADPETVVILQKFDMPRGEVQDVKNYIGAVTDITESSLSGTNIQNLLQWRDVSADGDVGDIYKFTQYTDEAQKVVNTAISSYGGVGAELSAVNVMNLIELEDTISGDGFVGDHLLLKQVALGTNQAGVNTLLAKGPIFEGSSAAVTNLANVADITGAGGGNVYGDIVRLDQYAAFAKQTANNWASAGSVHGLDMSATNGFNIANFDLSDMTGAADIELTQVTYNVTQDISNGVQAHGSVVGAALSGVNLGNIVTFVAAE